MFSRHRKLILAVSATIVALVLAGLGLVVFNPHGQADAVVKPVAPAAAPTTTAPNQTVIPYQGGDTSACADCNDIHNPTMEFQVGMLAADDANGIAYPHLGVALRHAQSTCLYVSYMTADKTYLAMNTSLGEWRDDPESYFYTTREWDTMWVSMIANAGLYICPAYNTWITAWADANGV